jgi:hypothetical protein
MPAEMDNPRTFAAVFYIISTSIAVKLIVTRYEEKGMLGNWMDPEPFCDSSRDVNTQSRVYNWHTGLARLCMLWDHICSWLGTGNQMVTSYLQLVEYREVVGNIIPVVGWWNFLTLRVLLSNSMNSCIKMMFWIKDSENVVNHEITASFSLMMASLGEMSKSSYGILGPLNLGNYDIMLERCLKVV